MAMTQGESQAAGWPDAPRGGALGTGEGAWLDRECGTGQISGCWQGAGPFVTRGLSVDEWSKGR
jgi:hypothetical protein